MNPTQQFAREEVQQVFDGVYNGLGLFVRDVNLPEKCARQYQPGLIIRERGFTDATHRLGGLLATHRFGILSNRMKDLSVMDMENRGLCTALNGAYFKVLACHTYQPKSTLLDTVLNKFRPAKPAKTLILLLHLPDDESWQLFQSLAARSNDEELIETCIKDFEKRCHEAPIADLDNEEWLARCGSPLGMDEDGTLFELSEQSASDGVAHD